MRDGAPLVSFGPRGRLGNLMFQTAAAIGYSKKYGVPWGVPRNMGEVSRFHEFFPGLPICETKYRSHHEHFDNSFCHVHGCGKDQCWYNYHEIPFYQGGVTLQGFWQSWKYFENAEDEVRKALRLDNYQEFENKVSVHCRRGDYVQYANSFPPVPVAYIEKAIAEFPNATRFVVFSDGLDWCKENFQNLPANFEYCDESNERKALSYMASCTGGNIIANSTFSYWSAYLRHNQSAKVVSPSHRRGCWFGMTSGVRQDCIDLIPPDWTQIEFR